MAKTPKDAAPPAPALTIVCRKPGFRRAGVAHPDRAEYPAGHFTAEQLEQLKAEPMLTVIEAPDAPGAGA